MRRQWFAILAFLLGGFPYLALAEGDPGPPAPLDPRLGEAEDLMGQRKFDDALTKLGEVVAGQDEDRASAAMAQYRIGLYE